MSEKKSTGWQNIRRQLDDWSKPALIALVKDLHDVSPDNRDFLLARFQAEENAGAALEKYRHKIMEQFFPARGDGKLKLAEARKAIRDYRKATGNLTGTIDLMPSRRRKPAADAANPLPIVTSARFCRVEWSTSRGIRVYGQPVERSKPRVGHGGDKVFSFFRAREKFIAPNNGPAS